MNAPACPEVFVRAEPTPQLDLPLSASGVLRFVWESRFGPMLIEVRDGCTFVNNQLVEPLEVSAPAAPQRSQDRA